MTDETQSRQKQSLQQVNPDSRDVYEIEARVIATTPNVLDTGTPEEFVEFLHEGGMPSVYMKFDESGKAVGYLALSALDNSDAMEVRSIAVEPEHQHHGYGKSMMMEAEQIAQLVGRKRIILVTSPDNQAAIQFYQHLGYVITNTIDNYYGDGTPRHVMEKPL